MKYIPSIILLIESFLTFIYYFNNDNTYNNTLYLKLILGVVFLITAILIYIKSKNKLIQWITIILSLVWGPGSFIGIGGISAIALAITFFALKKNK